MGLLYFIRCFCILFGCEIVKTKQGVNFKQGLFTGTGSERNIALYQKLGYKIFDEKQVTAELSFVYMEKV